MPNPKAYIAGVGVYHIEATSSQAVLDALMVSAGVKALLDAGVTYDDVDQSVACFFDQELKATKSGFETYGTTGTPVYEIEVYTGLHTAIQFVKSGHANCVLMVGVDKGHSQGSPDAARVAAIGVVLVSQKFLSSHAYLKDSSALILSSRVAGSSQSENARDETTATKRAIQAALQEAVLAPEDVQVVELRHGSNSSIQRALGELRVSEDNSASPVSHPFVGSTGLSGMCELVWQLRGWTRDRAVPQTRNCLQYTLGPDGSAYVTILCRADGKLAPSWEKVEYVRDGRERLGHNPAMESQDISLEDWQSVTARDNPISESVRKRLKLPVKGGDRAALSRL